MNDERSSIQPRHMAPVLLLPMFAVFLALSGCASMAAGKPAAAPVIPAAQSMAAAEQAEQRGDYNNALVHYVRAVSAEARNAEVHYRIGRMHVQLGNTDTAVEAFRRALALDPAHVGSLESAGLILLESRDRDGAAILLEKAVELDGTRWRSLNALGVIADMSARQKHAREYYLRALNQQPERAEILNNLGYSHYLSGDYARATGYFRRTLATVPGHEKAWTNLGLVRARLGEYADAVSAFREVMSEPEAYYTAGYVCMLDGRTVEAERFFRQAIESSPTYHVAAHDSINRLHRESRMREMSAPVQSVAPEERRAGDGW